MKYPNVKNAHIVPRAYLESWAVDGKIGVVQVLEKKRLEMAVENVGTRRQFYQRERPDGSKINDIEWTLGELESKATPLLRACDEDWPLPKDDKVVLATLFAFQHLRTPRWKNEYESRTDRFLEQYDAANPPSLPPAELEEYNAQLRSNTNRLVMMLSTATTATAVFASMHWCLLEFERPLVATSDHPLVLWHGAESRSPAATDITQIGIFECIEIRLPLSPTHAVLMTWSDHPDDEHVRVRATRDHAANLNAFTVASAERQWFRRPGASTPCASGNLRPLSAQLIPGYTAHAAATSRRRQRASEYANSKVGRDLSDQEIEVVTVSRPERS
jgi:Protein of unknown function (DUF4238)